MGINQPGGRNGEITTIASKLSTNQGAKNLNRDGGNAGVFSSRCTIVGQTGRETRPQGRRLVPEKRVRGRAPLIGSGAAGRCHHARGIRRGCAGHRSDARMAPRETRRALQEVWEMQPGGVDHAAAWAWDFIGISDTSSSKPAARASRQRMMMIRLGKYPAAFQFEMEAGVTLSFAAASTGRP